MSTAQPIGVRDMTIVHRTFRDAYGGSAQTAPRRTGPLPPHKKSNDSWPTILLFL